MNGSGSGKSFIIPCLANDRWSYTLFQDPYLQQASSLARGKSFVQLVNDQSQIAGIGSSILLDDTLWEYQLSLDKIVYTHCEWDVGESMSYTAENAQRICAMNFAVTDGFYMHQGATLATTANTDLERFQRLDGTVVMSQGDLSQISSNTSSYASSEIERLMILFVDKYSPIASVAGMPSSVSLQVLLTNWGSTSLTQPAIKKVPNQEVYVYDGVDPLYMKQWDIVTDIPFTLVVTQADLIIAGSIDVPGMYVLPSGSVIFENTNCDVSDEVMWLFITDGQFVTVDLHNDSVYQQGRCDGGRLTIHGALIGGEFSVKDLSERRRSLLHERFDISNETQQEKIFDAASVLIRTSSELWSRIPPGLDHFDEVVTVQR